MDYDRKKYLALKWLQCVEDCEKSGYDGSTEHAKDFLELAEPELLSLHGFETKGDIKRYAIQERESERFHVRP